MVWWAINGSNVSGLRREGGKGQDTVRDQWQMIIGRCPKERRRIVEECSIRKRTDPLYASRLITYTYFPCQS